MFPGNFPADISTDVNEPQKIKGPKAIQEVLKYETTSAATSTRTYKTKPDVLEVKNTEAESVTCLKVLPGTRICLEARVNKKPTSNSNPKQSTIVTSKPNLNESTILISSASDQASVSSTHAPPAASARELEPNNEASESKTNNTTSLGADLRGNTTSTSTAVETTKTTTSTIKSTASTSTATSTVQNTRDVDADQYRQHHVYFEEGIPLDLQTRPDSQTTKSPRQRMIPTEKRRENEKARKKKWEIEPIKEIKNVQNKDNTHLPGPGQSQLICCVNTLLISSYSVLIVSHSVTLHSL